jgi:hypothetical protein
MVLTVGIRFSLFQIKWIVGVSNGVYEVNISTSFKNLNNMELCIPLDVLTLNSDHKMERILVH